MAVSDGIGDGRAIPGDVTDRGLVDRDLLYNDGAGRETVAVGGRGYTVQGDQPRLAVAAQSNAILAAR
jgi:hypothetical protein